MDVGVVTPKRDGMNLVAKEMIICNPRAALMISSGAGTEQQLNSNGFYTPVGLILLNGATCSANVRMRFRIRTLERSALSIVPSH